MDDIKIFGNWLELAEDFSTAQKMEFYWALIELRQGHEVDLEKLDSEVRGTIKGIKRSIELGNEKIKIYKGDRVIADSGVICSLARSGASAREIAEKMGLSVSAVYHNEGWINRRNKDWRI